jgi:hypothetical protein
MVAKDATAGYSDEMMHAALDQHAELLDLFSRAVRMLARGLAADDFDPAARLSVLSYRGPLTSAMPLPQLGHAMCRCCLPWAQLARVSRW